MAVERTAEIKPEIGKIVIMRIITVAEQFCSKSWPVMRPGMSFSGIYKVCLVYICFRESLVNSLSMFDDDMKMLA